MKSFFGAIQHWFSGDLYGRHLGLILQEIGNRHPKALTSFICQVCDVKPEVMKNVRFQAEFTFHGQSSMRRADLAILPLDTDDPIVLVEIKYHDKLLPATEKKPAQLADYQFWRGANPEGRHVLLLTRDPYVVQGINAQRWSALARHLRAHAKHSDLIDMLVDYLEEEGSAMQDINPAALTRYIKRYLCNREFGANNLDGPVEFANVLKNMQLLSGSFHGYFKEAREQAGESSGAGDFGPKAKSASIDFEVWNRLKPIKEGKPMIDAYGGLRGELKDGGTVSVLAKHSLGHGNHWLRVAYGVEFNVSPGDSETDPPEAHLFAQIRGAEPMRKEISIYEQKKINFSWVTDEVERRAEKIETIFTTLLKSVIDQALAQKLDLLTRQKKALKHLAKNLPVKHRMMA